MIGKKNKNVFFIIAGSTDFGKSYILGKIADYLQKSKSKFDIIKPIISGFDINNKENDLYHICQKLNIEYNINNCYKISYFRYKSPLSPNIAAKYDNIDLIDYNKLLSLTINKINSSLENNDYLLIETAGGIMTPINDNKIFTDYIRDIQAEYKSHFNINISSIYISSNFLGVISNILTNLYVIDNLDIKLHKIIFNPINKDNYKDNFNVIKSMIKDRFNNKYNIILSDDDNLIN